MEIEVNYEPITIFFEDVASPQEIVLHLDQLLYCLVYYEHKEGIEDLHEIYSDIFEFKQVLQILIKSGELWK